MSNHERSATESGQIEEDYSQNFTESIADIKNNILPFKIGPNIQVTDTEGQSVILSGENPATDTVTQSGVEVAVENSNSQYESSLTHPTNIINDQESEDQEVMVSSKSIQWEVDFRKKENSVSESYKEDLTSEESQKILES